MAFRFRKNRVSQPPICRVDTLSEVSTVRDDGLVSTSLVVVDATTIDVVPSPEDYTLEKLLASGTPLSVVSSEVVSSTPTEEQINNIVSSLN